MRHTVNSGDVDTALRLMRGEVGEWLCTGEPPCRGDRLVRREEAGERAPSCGEPAGDSAIVGSASSRLLEKASRISPLARTLSRRIVRPEEVRTVRRGKSAGAGELASHAGRQAPAAKGLLPALPALPELKVGMRGDSGGVVELRVRRWGISEAG